MLRDPSNDREEMRIVDVGKNPLEVILIASRNRRRSEGTGYEA